MPLGSNRAYVVKYSADGAFQWVRAWSTDAGSSAPASTSALALTLDASGNLFVAGDYAGVDDFDGSDGSDTRDASIDGRVYLVSYASSGAYRWVRTFGNGRPYSVAADGVSGILMTGYTVDTADWDPGSGTLSHETRGASEDAFTSRFLSDGTFRWCRFVEGPITPLDAGYATTRVGTAVVGDGVGNAYVTGWFEESANFDAPTGADVRSANAADVFLIKYGVDGSYIWGRNFGGSDADRGLALAIEPSAGIAVLGSFTGTADLDPGPRIVNRTGVPRSFFLSLFRTDGTLRALSSVGPHGGADGAGLAFRGPFALYVTGPFENTADFDPGLGVAERTALGLSDAFLWYLGGLPSAGALP
jgi:hypothetical protein